MQLVAVPGSVPGSGSPDAILRHGVRSGSLCSRRFPVFGSPPYPILRHGGKAVAMSGQMASKTIVATLISVRDGAAWKPATKLQSGVRNIVWSVSADNVIKQAGDWVKANAGK